ncbi:cadherin-23 [Platysternon megacephalum]|uniref:Cadherin-23 n=1 Tax=Platysternon megacephalum TaxID=55544 RepID=A0A4D9ENF0_9SAUR|nr:cadherin-23 [Platysternon megacephalum]
MGRGQRQSQAGIAGAVSSSWMVRPALKMSASAIRRKSYKKAQGQAGPFSPAHWDEADGGQVHAGKLQVMEKFFTPLQRPKEGKGSERELSRCRQQWMEGRIDRFSSSSSSAVSSTTAVSWSSEASLEKEAFLVGGPMSQPQHSQSCVDISREARALRRGGEGTASYKAEEPVSFPRLKKGHSQSVDRLSRQRGPQEAQSPPPAQAGGESRLYKASSLERSLVFNEQTEILAPRLHKRAGAPAPSKGILKNGAVAKGDGLRKAKSIETFPVRAGEREPRGPLPPRAEEELELLPELGVTKKHHSMDHMKLVEEKLKFSEFLNEITRQVMSPSSLSSLGWKPPEAASAGKGSGTDSSESKSSSSKGSSQGSLAESREGQRQQERGPHGRRRGPRGDHTNPAPFRHMDNVSSLELGVAPQTRPGGEEQRRPGEGRPGHGEETEGHEQPSAPRKVEKERGSPPKEPWGKEQPEGTTQQGGAHCKAQSMAAERQTLNQHITELLERLISAQNTICTLERLNISTLLSESAGKHRHMEKANSADSLYSLHISDVAPPPAFMDSASDAHTTTPSQSDSATEANKPGCSSESDTALPNEDRTPVPNYHSLPPPGQLESHGRTTAFTPWKQQRPGELLEHVNSTESECSAEEGAQVHALPMSHFLYLRQEALVAPSVPTLPPTDALRPPSPQGLLLGGGLELVPVPELSSTDSSDGDEAWSQGLGEKEPGVSLDYQSAQKILDSLLRQHQHLEKEPAKASGGGYQDRNEMGQAKGHQRRIHYYWDFQSPGKEQPLLHQPQHGGGSLPRAKGEKVLQREQECGDGVMDSTLL